jgi:hypothetical protein
MCIARNGDPQGKYAVASLLLDAERLGVGRIVSEAVSRGYRFAVEDSDLWVAAPFPPPPRDIASRLSSEVSRNREAIKRYVANRLKMSGRDGMLL